MWKQQRNRHRQTMRQRLLQNTKVSTWSTGSLFVLCLKEELGIYCEQRHIQSLHTPNNKHYETLRVPSVSSCAHGCENMPVQVKVGVRLVLLILANQKSSSTYTFGFLLSSWCMELVTGERFCQRLSAAAVTAQVELAGSSSLITTKYSSLLSLSPS